MLTSELDKSDIPMAGKPIKKRGTEISNVIIQQNIAIKEEKEFKARKFVKEDVQIETINGNPITVSVWVSHDKPSTKRKKPKEVEEFICEICNKKFDEKRKLLIHARCHKSKPVEPIVKSVDEENTMESNNDAGTQENNL